MDVCRKIVLATIAAAMLAGQLCMPWQLGCVFGCCRQVSETDAGASEEGEPASPACCRAKRQPCCEREPDEQTDPVFTRIERPCECGRAPAQPVAVRTVTTKTPSKGVALRMSIIVDLASAPRRVGKAMHDSQADLPPPAWVRNCSLLL